ncbi:hypothetical protein [Paenibacillus cremeus]|uniref:hypothetical protein n=1 Tax=Paenibacillus cremeus TaxID=2163881 RepID=UPI0011A2EB2E|nr:hypothetical protein [Paenibacillus cremeus]
MDVPEVLAKKKLLYCIGNYNHQSKMTTKRIARHFGVNHDLFCTVPFHPAYLDAQNDGDIPGCFIRWYGVKKKRFSFDPTSYFMDSIRDSAKKVLNALDIHVQPEDLDDDN